MKYHQRRSHGGILGILGSLREPHGPQAYMGPGRSMNCMAEESKRISGNGHLIWPKTKTRRKKEGPTQKIWPVDIESECEHKQPCLPDLEDPLKPKERHVGPREGPLGPRKGSPRKEGPLGPRSYQSCHLPASVSYLSALLSRQRDVIVEWS